MKAPTFLLSLFLALLCQLLFLVAAQTAGGTGIVNQAETSYSISGADRTVASNRVTALIDTICALNISPNGSLPEPAYRNQAEPGETLYFPYLIYNTGNVNSSFDLNLVLESSSTLVPESLKLYLDTNTNGELDAGESELSSLSLSIGESAQLLVEVMVPSDYSNTGELHFNLVGNCTSDSSIIDEDNISTIFVSQGGVSLFNKTATPISGTTLTPGSSLSYSVSFEVEERALKNAVLTDVLDAQLDSPISSLITINSVLFEGLAVYDETTHTVTADLGNLNPNDKIILTIITTVKTNALANNIINNQASLEFQGGQQESTQTSHPVLGFCAVNVNPNGNTESPAYSLGARAGETLHAPYIIENTGNETNTYSLSAQALFTNVIGADLVSVIYDSNANGQLDESESSISSLTLEPLESAALLLQISLPQEGIADPIYVNLIASCSTDPQIKDDDNVSEVSLLVEGLETPQKTSSPESGTPVFPGASIDYSIRLKVRDFPIENVTVTDPISELLEAPTDITSGTISDPDSGLSATVSASYNETRRELIWQFEQIPAGMNVVLGFKAQVRRDLIASDEEDLFVVNTATVRWGSEEEPTNTTSNPTRHEVRPLLIQLEKTASPSEIRIGETLTYSLTVTNPQDSVFVQKLELSDDLPEQVRYRPGTTVVTLADGSEDLTQPTVEGQKLTWNMSNLGIGEKVIVRFEVTVLASALDTGEIVNTADVVASDLEGRATADAAANAATVVNGGFFRVPSILIGTVFIDSNDDDVFDENTDVPVEGVRLYLSDGRAILSDVNGRYTFLDILPGLEVLKVDPETLPGRILKESKNEFAPGLWRVKLEPGQITRQDVALLPPGARLKLDQILNVYRGPVHVSKQVHQDHEAQIIHVRLIIRSSETVKNLRITDLAATGAQLSTSNISLTENAVFNLGTFEANSEQFIEYQFEGNLEDALVSPEIVWSVR